MCEIPVCTSTSPVRTILSWRQACAVAVNAVSCVAVVTAHLCQVQRHPMFHARIWSGRCKIFFIRRNSIFVIQFLKWFIPEKKIMISFLCLSFSSHTARTKKQTIKQTQDKSRRHNQKRRVDPETNVVNYKTRTKEADATKLQTTANFSTYL